MEKINVPIKGMHCRSCELIIEEELLKIPGITKAKVSHKRKSAEIYSTAPISQSKIEEAIKLAGYEIGVEEENKPWITADPDVYKNLTISALIIIVLYFILKSTGLFDVNFNSNSSSLGLALPLVMGLTAGFSTCMALIGGLTLAISSKYSDLHPDATSMQKFRPHLFFNLGRVISFAILGGAIGLLGKVFQLSGATIGLLTIAVSVLMLIIGLQLTEISPKISGFSISLPSGIAKAFGLNKQEKEYNHKNAMLVGALTFFLPCGFTQAMQLYAISSGSFVYGAVIMGLFAIGTMPGLLGIGGLTSFIKGKIAKSFFKFAGVVVVILALFNFSNGWNLTGWTIASGGAQNNQIESNVPIENGVQIAKMTQSTFGYDPDYFVVKKGIPVKWIINSENINTCASSIFMPKMNIRKYLEEGENVIEFTPTEEGTIKFSCSMGMYTGKFTIIN
ncbi:MAG: heavy metal transport/detoxification protein [Candidatus Peregrinibacteria bacterium GW2011_GWC2_39_14]|nr:MAG: Heavy metal transport/detoxification protein [Candidatus Peregrinibacteria bacterium GW2011_GWA2_38_36]KKR04665.1 MAG: heavy metal transport/detoxification protein [Candidatus Peregrinibacteria bacterium GW2011_GWC2_39_14]